VFPIFACLERFCPLGTLPHAFFCIIQGFFAGSRKLVLVLGGKCFDAGCVGLDHCRSLLHEPWILRLFEEIQIPFNFVQLTSYKLKLRRHAVGRVIVHNRARGRRGAANAHRHWGFLRLDRRSNVDMCLLLLLLLLRYGETKNSKKRLQPPSGASGNVASRKTHVGNALRCRLLRE
jgi:hypothetical protein